MKVASIGDSVQPDVSMPACVLMGTLRSKFNRLLADFMRGLEELMITSCILHRNASNLRRKITKINRPERRFENNWKTNSLFTTTEGQEAYGAQAEQRQRRRFRDRVQGDT